MKDEEQDAICNLLTKACMWGYGGIQSVILDALEKRFPLERRWRQVTADGERQARRDAVGVVKDEKELLRWLRMGYWLCNYEPGEISLFNPPPMKGLCKYVVGDLAEKYGPSHDRWNYNVFQRRAAMAANSGDSKD